MMAMFCTTTLIELLRTKRARNDQTSNVLDMMFASFSPWLACAADSHSTTTTYAALLTQSGTLDGVSLCVYSQASVTKRRVARQPFCHTPSPTAPIRQLDVAGGLFRVDSRKS